MRYRHGVLDVEDGVPPSPRNEEDVARLLDEIISWTGVPIQPAMDLQAGRGLPVHVTGLGLLGAPKK